MSTTMREAFGQRHDVTLHLAAWDGVGADVDLSCACMFTREASGSGPAGGLAHLNAALENRLVAWREAGWFKGSSGETLFLDRPPSPIRARSVLVIGLGDPAAWSTSVIAGAVRIGFASAGLRAATSAAFAPSMLDAGLTPDRTGDAADQMVNAIIAAIDLDARLQKEGLTSGTTVRDWVFDVGAARFDSALLRFREIADAAPPSLAR